MIQPLFDRVVVKPLDAEEKTESGIILPASAQEKQTRGTIVAVGPGPMNENTGEYLPMAVKEGDEVVFGKYAGTELKWEDVEYLVVGQGEILAVV